MKPRQPPKIIAHRGYSARHHDNTMPAFTAAANAGADYIEVDVRRTKDGVLILFHDHKLNGNKTNQTKYPELQQLAKEEGYEIPTIDEIMDHANQHGYKIDFEIKEQGYETILMETINNKLKPNQYIITSFHDNTLKIIKEQYPDTRTGLLLGETGGLVRNWKHLFPSKRLKDIKADIALPHYRLLRYGITLRIYHLVEDIYVWTVNKPTTIQLCLLDRHITGIITDTVGTTHDIIHSNTQENGY